MKKTSKILKGLSFKLDALFFRNLTLLMAAIFIWRGAWNLIDKYFLPHDFILSNLVCIFIGIVLLFIFDSEVEEDEKSKRHSTRRTF